MIFLKILTGDKTSVLKIEDVSTPLPHPWTSTFLYTVFLHSIFLLQCGSTANDSLPIYFYHPKGSRANFQSIFEALKDYKRANPRARG